MRQGIVMEKHRRYAVVMTQDGAFQKAKPIPNSMPGDEVEFEPFEEKQWSFAVFPKSLKPSYRMIAMVTALLIAILPLYSWFDSNKAYAYVNIDMNPSIEMKVNNKMKVMEMIPLNDDASLLVEKITDWKNKSVEKVTVTVIEKGEEIGLINENKSVMIGVSYKKQMEKNKRITEMIDQYLQTNPLNLTVATFEVPEELRKKAQKEKKSMNELFAKQYSNDILKTSTNEKKGNDINAEEEKAIQSFYNKEDNEDQKSPDSTKNDQDQQSENGQSSSDQVNDNQEEEKEPKEKKQSTNPVGKEKGWAKDKNKKEEDQNTDNQQNDDLPSGLEKKDLEELLKSLPPGIQKKLEREGIEDLEELLESLPPGLLKKIETSDLQEIREKLRRLDSDLFSDFNRDQKKEDEDKEEEDRDGEDDREDHWNNGNNSKQTPPGQAKKEKKNRKDNGQKRGWEKRNDDRENQEREDRDWEDRDDDRDDRGRENRGRGHGKDKKDRDDED